MPTVAAMFDSSPRSGLAAGAVVLALGATACGSSSPGASSTKAPNPNAKESSPAGDIPDNQAYVAFTPPGGGFSVKVPEGWAQRTAGGAVAFTDKLNTIRIESRTATAPLTVQKARSGELSSLAHSVKGFKAGTVTTVARKGGTAVRITYLASSPADPVTGKTVTDAVERYVFFHNGRAVVLTLSGPKGADNVDPWRLVSDSVRWSA
jgi:hypothetical protein